MRKPSSRDDRSFAALELVDGADMEDTQAGPDGYGLDGADLRVIRVIIIIMICSIPIALSCPSRLRHWQPSRLRTRSVITAASYGDPFELPSFGTSMTRRPAPDRRGSPWIT
jgi:hypothetical protein